MTDISTTTSLYIYRDAGGLAIYVGITGRGVQRSVEHRESSLWWPYTASATIQHFPDFPSAQLAEKEMIRRYRPPFNILHNLDAEEIRDAYVSWRSASARMICESDGTRFTFTLGAVGNSGLVRELVRTATRAPNRIIVGDSFIQESAMAPGTVTLVPRDAQSAGRFRLMKHFDPVRKGASTWVIDLVPSD